MATVLFPDPGIASPGIAIYRTSDGFYWSTAQAAFVATPADQVADLKRPGALAIQSVQSDPVVFESLDTATQGNWKGVYGLDGAELADDIVALPSYATVTLTGNGDYLWAASSTDVKALQKGAAGSTDRIAASWYGSLFTIDVNLADGDFHAIALYVVDLDGLGRTQTIDVLDASTGNVLDTRNVSTFSGGEYLTWNVKGHVKFRVASTGPSSAVVSGIFFGPPILTVTVPFPQLYWHDPNLLGPVGPDQYVANIIDKTDGSVVGDPAVYAEPPGSDAIVVTSVFASV